jgi:hypothetical protein
VALLSTIIRANMVMIVAGVISQLKWSWFTERPRPLSHLQDFDAGSRSGIGSVRLIWMLATRGRTASVLSIYAIIAAAVIVLSFVVGPFMQQAIRTDVCARMVPGVNSSIPVTNFALGENYRIAAGQWEVTVDMKGTMVQGLTNPASQDLAIKAFCPTGNCTFPNYGTGVTHSSIGMCSKCRDRSADIKGPDNNGNITLDGASFESGGASPSLWIALQSMQPFLATTSYEGSSDSDLSALGLDAGGLQTALASVSILTASNSPCTNGTAGLTCPHSEDKKPTPANLLYGGVGDFIATTCVLYPCLKTYNGAVVDGVLEETVVDTVPATSNHSISMQGNYTAVRSPCVLDDSGVWYTEANMSSAPKIDGRTFQYIMLNGVNTSVPNACLYKLDWMYSRALTAFIGDLFDGTCSYDTRQGDNLLCRDRWWLSPLYNQKNASFESLSSAMDKLAAAITSKFRTYGWGPDEIRSLGQWQGAGYGVKGAIAVNSACTNLEWRWLLLPCGLLFISAVLLGWTIVRNYGQTKDPMWKSNVLPLVLYGLGNDPSPSPQQIKRQETSLQAVQEQAKDIRVRCVVREGGQPGFVSENQTYRRRDDGTYSLDSLLYRHNNA